MGTVTVSMLMMKLIAQEPHVVILSLPVLMDYALRRHGNVITTTTVVIKVMKAAIVTIQRVQCLSFHATMAVVFAPHGNVTVTMIVGTTQTSRIV